MICICVHQLVLNRSRHDFMFTVVRCFLSPNLLHSVSYIESVRIVLNLVYTLRDFWLQYLLVFCLVICQRTKISDVQLHAHLFGGITHKQSHLIKVVNLNFVVHLSEDFIKTLDFYPIVLRVEDDLLSSIIYFKALVSSRDTSNNRIVFKRPGKRKVIRKFSLRLSKIFRQICKCVK